MIQKAVPRASVHALAYLAASATRERYLTALDTYIDANGIENFTAEEICDIGRDAADDPNGQAGRGVVELQRAPAHLWRNIIPTLHVDEWLRAALGNRPLYISSGYRDARYNAAVGGADQSLHKEFGATDLHCLHTTPQKMARALEDHPDADRLGIGVYGPDDGSFVHVDTRGLIGRSAPARW